MLRFTMFLSAVCTFLACGPNKQDPETPQNADGTAADSLVVLNDPKSNLNIQTNSFSEIDSSGILMFPLSMGQSERDGSSLSYKSTSGGSYWNIIFLNSKTNEYHLLSERKMLIRSYDFKYSDKSEIELVPATAHIFYAITCDDFNKDKKLTGKDPKYLFVSDKEGRGFRQISPSNYDIQNWQYIKSVNKIMLTVIKDSDKNLEFDETDEVATFEVEIDKGTAPREVFSTEFKNKLKLLLDIILEILVPVDAWIV